ncbi:hypothetical protein Lal_00034583 [Lupinus albus]|nr:hypothetical protein Lal_00034583 [Lupinus albus]
MVLAEPGSPGHNELVVLQPVIPTLLRARGCRCSVKPASRCALLFRIHETCAFAQITRNNSQLVVGKPTTLHSTVQPKSHATVPSH